MTSRNSAAHYPLHQVQGCGQSHLSSVLFAHVPAGQPYGPLLRLSRNCPPMSSTPLSHFEAEHAFDRAARARRWASLICRLRRNRNCGRLTVYAIGALRRTSPRISPQVREVALDAIGGTLERNRAADFDRDFRPAAPTRARWQRVWMAEQRGTVLPPISVVQLDGVYAIRDGHHRVSVAKARGALTISAVVDAG